MPQTLAHALADSPVGQLAWNYQIYGDAVSFDYILTNVVWIAVSVYVLVAILKKELQLPQSLHSILQILSVSTFEKVPLNQLLTMTLPENYETEDPNQLMLWDL